MQSEGVQSEGVQSEGVDRRFEGEVLMTDDFVSSDVLSCEERRG